MEETSQAALLAAIAANESGGCRQAYRFEPANYQRLEELVRDGASTVEGLTRAQLEKRLRAAASEAERAALLKKLAGLHGHTQLPGFCSILWGVPLEAHGKGAAITRSPPSGAATRSAWGKR